MFNTTSTQPIKVHGSAHPLMSFCPRVQEQDSEAQVVTQLVCWCVLTDVTVLPWGQSFWRAYFQQEVPGGDIAGSGSVSWGKNSSPEEREKDTFRQFSVFHVWLNALKWTEKRTQNILIYGTNKSFP